MQALLDTIAAAEPGPDARRLFHGRGGRHPALAHWSLDAYPPVWLTTSFRPAEAAELEAIGAVLAARAPDWAWVHQERQPGRSETRLMAGSVPERHWVSEAGTPGTRYRVHLQRGQNHGLFLDMAEGRRWVRQAAAAQPGMKVLNLFAYTCAFSVLALQGGAASVLNLDMAAGALAIGRENHRLNGISGGATFLAHELFKSWGKLRRGGPYALIIVDPPSYQKGSFVAAKDYPRLLQRLPDLLAPGGQALLCLNAPELDTAFLHAALAERAPGLRVVQRLPNPPAFDDVAPERALKVLLVQA
jgi:23S rRNA (cytosine1962-C5)-methyltransferase